MPFSRPHADPFRQFESWFAQAKKTRAILDATAVCLSTISPNGYPSGRMMLLKDFDEDGFVVYTNLGSVKGASLKKNPRAALTFYWAPLGKQVRIQGRAEFVHDVEADAYWATRPRLSQLGAWASKQSQPLSSRSFLIKEVARLAYQYGTKPIPRPPYWTGVRVIPDQIEFWQAGLSRLHDRFRYTKTTKGWQIQRLYP